MIRRLASRLLERAGYAVVAVADGGAVLDRLKRSSDEFDCILLDVEMPGVDGRRALSEIRRQKAVPAAAKTGAQRLAGLDVTARQHDARTFLCTGLGGCGADS